MIGNRTSTSKLSTSMKPSNETNGIPSKSERRDLTMKHFDKLVSSLLSRPLSLSFPFFID